ncbi:MAG: GTP cyclohydrolase I FolE [Lachnospiraceae bacterium]|nr:GTP cyclohydrolase I FolE [Lachnospiraceae bacterium]
MVNRHLTPEQFDTIKEAIGNILEALGDDPKREGLVDTPERVARMYDEIFEGMRYSNEEIADMFGKCFEEARSSDIVIVRDIEVFSHCEHHIALMYNMKVTVAYIPGDRVIGLSKICRIADMVCKRLQLQERITTDIADIMEMILKTDDIMVVVEGEHSCMSARGIKKPGATTVTNVYRGRFKNDPELRREVRG